MRRFLRGVRALVITLLALGIAAAALVLSRAPVFRKGNNYELYLSPSSSSLTVLTDDPLTDKFLLPVKGESVRYDGDEKNALIAQFRAKVLFTEKTAGVTNYYCFSPVLQNGLWLKGRFVNLHIAVSDTQTAVGTPLIFGGF